MKTDVHLSILKSMIESLLQDAKLGKTVAKANLGIEIMESNVISVPVKTFNSKKPLIERSDKFHEDPQLLSKNPNVVNLPPEMETVEAKPMFSISLSIKTNFRIR